ncbi:unnamed protein product, partial [Closterium sp. Naga37s-1]
PHLLPLHPRTDSPTPVDTGALFACNLRKAKITTLMTSLVEALAGSRALCSASYR